MVRYTHIGVVKGVGRTGRIVSFSLEDMTEVTAACCAGNFYPGHTVRAVFRGSKAQKSARWLRKIERFEVTKDRLRTLSMVLITMTTWEYM